VQSINDEVARIVDKKGTVFSIKKEDHKEGLPATDGVWTVALRVLHGGHGGGQVPVHHE
jgi:hypothetical protein